MAEFVVKRAVKNEVNKQGMLCSSDAYEAIDKYVKNLIETGINNAKNEGRKTVKAEDIITG